MTAAEAEIAEALARVKEAEAAERAAGEALNAARKATAAAEAAYCFARWNVRFGSIVRDKKGIYRVTEVRHGMHSSPFLTANPKRKDGTFGTAPRNLSFGWEVVEP